MFCCCLACSSYLVVVLMLASAAKTTTETKLTSDYFNLHPTPERPGHPSSANLFCCRIRFSKTGRASCRGWRQDSLSAVDVWLVGQNDAGALKPFTIAKVAE